MISRTRSPLTFGLTAAIATFAQLAPSHARGVRIVDVNGDRNYASIQAAVNDANAGDVLLIGAGTYSGFTIDKPLSLIAAPAGASVSVGGNIRIENVAGGSVVLSGLEVTAGATPAVDPCAVVGCDDVRFYSCIFQTHPGFTSWSPGINVASTASFVLDSCTAIGSSNPGSSYSDGGQGGSGLFLFQSSAAISSSTLTGGSGGDGIRNGGEGGSGMSIVDSVAFVSGSMLTGGDGGEGLFGNHGLGGHGVVGPWVGTSNTLRSLDNVFRAGWPLGSPVDSTVTLVSLPGSAREYSTPLIATTNSALSVTASGDPRDRVQVMWSQGTDFEYEPRLLGMWLIPRPNYLPLNLMPVVIPGAGSVSFNVDLPALPPTQAGRTLNGQGLSIAHPFDPRLGDSLNVYLLNRDATPDCNGNGIQDYAEIIEGTALDANSNLVPDACEHSGSDWYVDVNAAAGGNGSPGAPFQSIALAMAQVSANDTILVADGLYVGVNNRNLSFPHPSIPVMVCSMNGPTNCIIDCEGLGRAFELYRNEPRQTQIKGFTIRRGNGAAGTSGLVPGRGGAILLGGDSLAQRSSATIVGCIIEDCSAIEGAAVHMGVYGKNGSVLDSVIRNNVSPGNGIVKLRPGSVVANTLIENNNGCGIYAMSEQPQPPVRILNCTIRGNTWAGISIGATDLPAEITGCLIANNSQPHGGNDGGGIIVRGGSYVSITSCTIVGNHSPGEGGGLFSGQSNSSTIQGERYVSVTNSIIWGNTSSTGPPIVFAAAAVSASGIVSFDTCNIQGGQSSILFELPGTYGYSNNIDADPLFVDTHDYRIGAGSPCIDAANYAFLPADLGDLDSDGNTIELTPLDIDLEQRAIDDPGVADTGTGAIPWMDLGADERQP